MKRYRKLSVVIEAEQWFEVTYDREAGHGYSPAHSPIYHLDVGYYRRPESEYAGTKVCALCGRSFHDHGWLEAEALENGYRVCPGDWIIRGVGGEFYPIKNEIFAKNHEAVE